MTSGQQIDYFSLAQDALRGIVRSVLEMVVDNNGELPGEHHFFIAFDTRADDVVMSNRLREQYPKEMTVVLQHRFWDLQVHEDRFQVQLTFNNLPERLVIPFKAIKGFFDPSAQFALPLEQNDLMVDQGDIDEQSDNETSPSAGAASGEIPGAGGNVTEMMPQNNAPLAEAEEKHATSEFGSDEKPDDTAATDDGETSDDEENSSVVVELDAFRKK